MRRNRRAASSNCATGSACAPVAGPIAALNATWPDSASRPVTSNDHGAVDVADTWTDGDLCDVVAESDSFSGVARKLGYNTSGGMHRFLRTHIERLGINTDHFTGRAWAKGTLVQGS